MPDGTYYYIDYCELSTEDKEVVDLWMERHGLFGRVTEMYCSTSSTVCKTRDGKGMGAVEGETTVRDEPLMWPTWPRCTSTATVMIAGDSYSVTCRRYEHNDGFHIGPKGEKWV